MNYIYEVIVPFRPTAFRGMVWQPSPTPQKKQFFILKIAEIFPKLLTNFYPRVILINCEYNPIGS
jgi:hypothetical protein